MPNKFKKTEKQKEATKLLSSLARDIMLFGGGRSGKTFILVRAMLIRACKVKSNHAIFRFRFNHVRQSIWSGTLPKVIDTCFKHSKNAFHFNKSMFVLELINGSMVYVGGLDEKDRTEKILGNEFSTILINECSQVSFRSVQIARTRLAERNSLKKKMLYDENPPSKAHWSYKYFIQKINPETNAPANNPDRISSLLMNPSDNLENIDESYLDTLEDLPENMKKRYRDGIFSEEQEGKVFKEKWIKRIWEMPVDLSIVVSIDPAVSLNENSDEYGITVCGRFGDFGILLEDRSDKMTPNEMGIEAVSLFKQYGAQEIIVETNNGGDFIEAVIKQVDKFIPVRQVKATKGKVKRAIPVAHLYEQGRIFHYGVFTKLEDEMMIFDEDETRMKGLPSPNRCDAMVWGFAALFQLDEVEFKIRHV